MAASSPVPNNEVGDPDITTATINGITMPQRSTVLDTPKQSQRGLNKPKCIKCGNVARSRCPFQSCKNCCAKAQNPCHIHVLKQSSILPDKPLPSTAALSKKLSPDLPSTGASWRLLSLRQLSTAFANSLRAKKPLTCKDAVNINKWRFSKLREHIDGKTEVENEAFDRFMCNVNLLGETFSTEGLIPDDQPAPEPTSEKFQKLVSTMKVKLRSNSESADNCREGIRNLVDQRLRKLQGRDLVSNEGSHYADEIDACEELKRPKKKGEWRPERTAALNVLVDKLSRARSEDDWNSCLEMKLKLLNHSESKVVDTSSELDAEEPLVPKQELDSVPDLSSYSLPKVCIVHINQEALLKINADLSSLDQLAEL